MKKPIETIPAETMAALTAYDWPGNIRELQNLIERAVILSRGPTLDVPLHALGAARPAATGSATEAGSGTLEAAERRHITAVLNECDWVVGGDGRRGGPPWHEALDAAVPDAQAGHRAAASPRVGGPCRHTRDTRLSCISPAARHRWRRRRSSASTSWR